MVKVFTAGQLAAQPADLQQPSKTGNNPGQWFEVANLSPFIFELVDDAGQIRGVAGPFRYTAIPMAVVSDHITLRAVGQEAASAVPAASFAVYAGLTKRPPAGAVLS